MRIPSSPYLLQHARKVAETIELNSRQLTPCMVRFETGARDPQSSTTLDNWSRRGSRRVNESNLASSNCACIISLLCSRWCVQVWRWDSERSTDRVRGPRTWGSYRPTDRARAALQRRSVHRLYPHGRWSDPINQTALPFPALPWEVRRTE